ncbi:MAG: LPS-assembly protein LptD [Muribaculaceae bacterium]|nr:LPS-assembly protein LptD [Muribaculaceae bacterium]
MRQALLYIFALFVAVALAVGASEKPQSAARVRHEPVVRAPHDSVSSDSTASIVAALTDTAAVQVEQGAKALPDSAVSDTGRHRVSPFVMQKVDLDQPVNFSAKDSLVLIGDNQAYMYGNSTIKYGEVDLNAGRIKMDMDSSTVFASASMPDSVLKAVPAKGEKAPEPDYPVFSDGSGEYQSKTMRYNFKTERGYITDVVTQQGEGYLTGAVTKKMEDGTFNLEGGRYTTCDNHEHPHFYFQVTKGKMRPKKNIVTGPVYMVLADVPLPLALPFGFFPFNKSYSSGIIVPSFGEDYNRGFYLRDGGYYFAINDYVDLALRGEIYTRGSWGLSARSNYAKRYKYKGSFDISYLNTINGDKGDPDYMSMKNFRVTWNHSQDAKANPNLSFSAAVNFATSGYTRNDLNSYYNNSFTENTKSSTVNLTYRFPQSKWSVSATANIAQRTQDSTLTVSFPNFTVTLSQIAPFKRKRAIGGEKWYEKIRLSYSGQFQNSLTAQQDVFFKKNLIKDWRNAMKHSVPVTATFSVLKYLNISPSLSLNDRMYFNKIRRSWDPMAGTAGEVVNDTTYGFYNVFDFNASLSFDTKIYGFYRPAKFWGDKIQMVRHVITPTLTVSGAPDFGASMWGYYGSYERPGINGGDPVRTTYSYFDHGLFGVPGRGRQGIVSLSIANNLEMKVKSDADSTGMKKISLIENFTIAQSYNMAADSLNWSNLETSLLLRLTKNFNLNLSAAWDPYCYGLNEMGTPVKINKLRISAGKGWARLARTGTSFSYTINQDTFRKRKGNDTSSDNDDLTDPSDEDEDDEPQYASFADKAAAARKRNSKTTEDNSDSDGYEPWTVPWSLSFNYSLSYAYGEFDYNKMDYKGKWTQNLSLSGNLRPTPNWNFSFSASYNFDLHKIAYMNCSVSRDLHCFTLTASFVPVGPYKSYSFRVAVKSSILKDLKYDKRSSSSNGVSWY